MLAARKWFRTVLGLIIWCPGIVLIVKLADWKRQRRCICQIWLSCRRDVTRDVQVKGSPEYCQCANNHNVLTVNLLCSYANQIVKRPRFAAFQLAASQRHKNADFW